MGWKWPLRAPQTRARRPRPPPLPESGCWDPKRSLAGSPQAGATDRRTRTLRETRTCPGRHQGTPAPRALPPPRGVCAIPLLPAQGCCGHMDGAPRALTCWRLLGRRTNPCAAVRASFRRPRLAVCPGAPRPGGPASAGGARGAGGAAVPAPALPPQRQAGRAAAAQPDSRRRRAPPPPRLLPPAGWGPRAPAGSRTLGGYRAGGGACGDGSSYSATRCPHAEAPLPPCPSLLLAPQSLSPLSLQEEDPPSPAVPLSDQDGWLSPFPSAAPSPTAHIPVLVPLQELVLAWRGPHPAQSPGTPTCTPPQPTPKWSLSLSPNPTPSSAQCGP